LLKRCGHSPVIKLNYAFLPCAYFLYPKMMMFRLRTTGLSGWTGSGLGAMPMLRWLGWCVSGALVILGCWLAVRLLTGFTTPLPPPRQLVLQAPVAVAARLAEQALLGYAAPSEFSSTLPAGASALQNLQLLGVWSSKVSAEARAIVRQDGGGAPLVLMEMTSTWSPRRTRVSA
jgi:hypothetical protein